MNSFPDKFGIMDFYLNVCDKVIIRGVEHKSLRLMDVGKSDTISQAEDFIRGL